MKRSEMIEMLIDIIASENDEGQTANKLMAQSVLNLVEVAGMKPPSTGKKLIFNPFTETTEVSEKYEWEPEEIMKVALSLDSIINYKNDLCEHEFEQFDAYYEQCKHCGMFK